MLDLVSRNYQVKVAILEYERHLDLWVTSGAPDADDATRTNLQDQITPLMMEAKDPRANTAKANTNRFCNTTYEAPTACLLETVSQHERVHINACRSDPGRHRDLAEYAREEIDAYKAERSFIEAELEKLERQCRYTLEFDSMISGATETTRSRAKTDVDLAVHFPRGYFSKGFTGSKPLRYNTEDVGPPKVTGDSKLAKLYINCYAASHGSGNVSFKVEGAWLYRDRVPPHGPLLWLPIFVGDTQETRTLKGPRRGCPRGSEPVSFWTRQFELGKRVAPIDPPPAGMRASEPVVSDLAIIIDDWTFTGEDAEKVVETQCAGANVLAGTPGFEALPAGPYICEKTVLRMRKKP